MSLLTQFYPGPGSGGGLDGGQFAGGVYPGFSTSVTVWPASTTAAGVGSLSFSASPTGGSSQLGFDLQYAAQVVYFGPTSASCPLSIGSNISTSIDFSGAEYASFVNFSWFQSGGTCTLRDTNQVSGLPGASILKTISGAGFKATTSTSVIFALAGLVSFEGGGIGVNGGTVTFTTPLLTNIDTTAFAFNASGSTLSITNANLSIASVENVIFCALASETARGASVGGSINLSGGSNATLSSLSATAQAAVTTLNASGWVITLTP